MATDASLLYLAALPEADRSALDLASSQDLLGVCRRAVDAARLRGRPVLTSWAMPVPYTDALDVWRRSRRVADRAMLWRSAWDSTFLVAAGTAHDLSADGEDRIGAVRAAWAELADGAVTGGGPTAALPTGQGPLLVGGVAFAPAAGASRPPFPDALMWVPSVQIRGTAATTGRGAPLGELRLNAVVDRDSDPVRVSRDLLDLAERCLSPMPAAPDGPVTPPLLRESAELPPADDWKSLVGRAVRRMREGAFEKVVLAREVRYVADRSFDVPAAVDRLGRAYPEATLFAVRDSGFEFVGATPEYLVRLTGGTVHTLGLAGTTPRGATPEEDAAYERDLTGSAKILHEHDVVVRMLREALTTDCADLTVAPSPTVLKLANVQHLSTPVQGKLAEDAPGILEFAERLHPTPALGGHPRAASLDWLAKNEGLDRGWYAGGVGWSDTSGQGEFAVAIRSALVHGNVASLYAGCGIVADSDPEEEYLETCAKLRPMLHALGLA
ncbi:MULTISPECIES: isochorismate synthase [unclassified Streptomyces]|uniref:isochorismate synthase n=1 Tax=unclassified Streptomyces TaxID=2593676 RepID=UPI00037B7744|nr:MULTISPECIES: isochorismate synthase [unclassified Streptomyces]MYY05513.1 isochorismate synthase [Streptomyces sp. SID4913]